MFPRLLFQSFQRQRRRKLLAGLAVVLGMTVVTAMIAVQVDVGDKVNRELRSLGANILVTPAEDTLDVEIGGVNLKPASEGAFIDENDLPKLKQIFWAHNIVGFSPMLNTVAPIAGAEEPVPVVGTYFAKELRTKNETFVTGVRTTHPWWKVQGEWPSDEGSEVLLGERLAKKLGRTGPGYTYLNNIETKISGIVTTGGPEEDAVIVPLAMAQRMIGRPDAVRRVYVSALTKPEDDFARRDPKSMSPEMLERWSCTPYANSIAHQIAAAIPNVHAEQIRQVAQNEGALLGKIAGLMLLVTIGALVASILAVSAAMATTLFERRKEIGLMKSLGANNGSVVLLFLSEAGVLGLVGGLVGFGAGIVMAKRIGMAVFQSEVAFQPVLMPYVILLALAVTLAGSASSIRRAMKIDPAVVLRGDAA
ncbi:MAG TPA: ABC transporter permease [Terriglobales bacterium]|nr:ABC transporter permease [Terriglobales bacterium]